MCLNKDSELQYGKYRIVRVLGQGGFGITYLAEHTMLDKYVAIKEFFPKEYCDREDTTSHVTLGSKNTEELVGVLKSKFIKEAKNISKLRHPNIITIHDIFEENSTAYYVMEFIDGQSLSEIIKTKGAIDENSALNYIVKIADAVGYMHSLSMNHLDLKPANIMIRSIDGEPVLIDFGLSKQYDASGGQTSTTPVGISHGYAPVEQYKPGGVSTFTPQTDIYALGATLFALLSGNTPPHYSDILEDGLPELPSSVSSSTKEAIEHAMEIKKNKRPESIAEFLESLKNQPRDVSAISQDDVNYSGIDPKEYRLENAVEDSSDDVNIGNTCYDASTNDTQILPKEPRSAEEWENLGDKYLQGEGVNRDYNKAIQFYERGAELGSGSALNKLGNLYYSGLVGGIDISKAYEYYKLSADQGNFEAMVSIGILYTTGEGQRCDYGIALDWFNKALGQCNDHEILERVASAIEYMGKSYEYSDRESALHYLKESTRIRDYIKNQLCS